MAALVVDICSVQTKRGGDPTGPNPTGRPGQAEHGRRVSNQRIPSDLQISWHGSEAQRLRSGRDTNLERLWECAGGTAMTSTTNWDELAASVTANFLAMGH